MNYHDIIAAAGEGAAHPGGFNGTLEFIEDVKIHPALNILEVGCGTGRTACFLASQGCRVTALDQNDLMLEKASRRAKFHNVHISFIKGDICSIPLESELFNVVIAESVTVFADPIRAFKEYYRVLKKGGRVWDRELYKVKSHPEFETTMNKLYGNPSLPDHDQWIEMMYAVGFNHVESWRPQFCMPSFQHKHENINMDPCQFIDFDILQHPSIPQFTQQNEAFLKKFQNHISYRVFIGKK